MQFINIQTLERMEKMLSYTTIKKLGRIQVGEENEHCLLQSLTILRLVQNYSIYHLAYLFETSEGNTSNNHELDKLHVFKAWFYSHMANTGTN